MSQKKEPDIRASYRPSKKRKEVIDMVYRRKQEMSESEDRQAAVKEWENAEKQYNAYRPEKAADDWQSNIFIPHTTAVVEGILSEMIENSPRPLYLPRESSDVAAATLANHIFSYTWDIGNGDVELYKVIKDALIKGTGIAQEYYLKVPRKVKELVEFDPAKEIEKYEDRDIEDFDDCYMEAVRLDDFFVDETARGFDGPNGARDCIRRYVMNIDDVRSFFTGPIWNPFDAVKYVKVGGDTNYYEFYKPPQGLRQDKEVEVLWYWNKPEDKLAIVANDVLIRDGPNPYRHKQLPFARCVDIMKPHGFYGTGEPKLMESLQEELNTLRRMRLDRQHLMIDPMFIGAAREALDEEDLMVRPGGLIQVDDPKSFLPVETPDTKRSAYLEEDKLKEDITRVCGFDDRMQAVKTPGTATEAAILKESSLKRVRLKVRLLEKGFLTRIGRIRWANIQQFYSKPKVEMIVGKKVSKQYQKVLLKAKAEGRYERINGKDYEKKYRTIRIRDRELERRGTEIIERPHAGLTFFEVEPDLVETKGELDVSIKAGSTLPISKPLLQQRTEALYDRLVLNPGFDPVKLGESLLRVHDLDPDELKKEELIKPEEELDMELAEINMASMENEQMMQGKAMVPTPYVSRRHTQIHLAYVKSPKFMALPNDSVIVKIMAAHIAGEMEAQARRGSAPLKQEKKPQPEMGGVMPGGPKPTQQTAPGGPGGAMPGFTGGGQ